MTDKTMRNPVRITVELPEPEPDLYHAKAPRRPRRADAHPKHPQPLPGGLRRAGDHHAEHRPDPRIMTRAGRTIEVKRYRIPAGQRAIKAQRINGRVALIDVPVDHADRVYLIERDIKNQAELHGLADAYAQHSQTVGVPAILAT
ncbi:MAG: hypothetical protein LC790_02600 [Actinobacteria bacterium]|nr:hypothetical protein [Actinomycetota bacterium]MCA1697837.1 hypothetical protein [Actinomycetota bacterium]